MTCGLCRRLEAVKGQALCQPCAVAWEKELADLHKDVLGQHPEWQATPWFEPMFVQMAKDVIFARVKPLTIAVM